MFAQEPFDQNFKAIVSAAVSADGEAALKLIEDQQQDVSAVLDGLDSLSHKASALDKTLVAPLADTNDFYKRAGQNVFGATLALDDKMREELLQSGNTTGQLTVLKIEWIRFWMGLSKILKEHGVVSRKCNSIARGTSVQTGPHLVLSSFVWFEQIAGAQPVDGQGHAVAASANTSYITDVTSWEEWLKEHKNDFNTIVKEVATLVAQWDGKSQKKEERDKRIDKYKPRVKFLLALIPYAFGNDWGWVSNSNNDVRELAWVPLIL